MNADDVTRTVTLARDALAATTGDDWQAPAGTLKWTCWETVEHISDVLFGYATQISSVPSARTTYVPFGWSRRSADGPPVTVTGDPAEGPAGLLDVLVSCGEILAAMVTAVPADRLSFHYYGSSDASGFAAMGVVETLVHTHDAATGLGTGWTPPADLCESAVRRLFPSFPPGSDPWATLLDATGRGPVPRAGWKWDGSPR